LTQGQLAGLSYYTHSYIGAEQVISWASQGRSKRHSFETNS
jgi:hypothetical protein